MKPFLVAMVMAVAGVGAVTSTCAGPVPLSSANGSFDFTPMSATTLVGSTDVASATAVNIGVIDFVTNVSSVGNLGVSSGDPVAISPVPPGPLLTLSTTSGPISLPDVMSFTGNPSNSSDFLRFSITSIQWTSSPGNLSFIAQGTFNDLNSPATFASGPATLSGLFTQAQAGGPITTLFEFSSPSVPEPSSITLLGIGACGMAAVALRRRRQKAAAV